MEEGKELRKHLDEFNRIILELNNIGVRIDEEDQGIILLSSLPKSFEHFVDTILYGKESLTMADVKSALNSKEIQKKSDESTDDNGEGLYSKGKSDKRESKNSSNQFNSNN